MTETETRLQIFAKVKNSTFNMKTSCAAGVDADCAARAGVVQQQRTVGVGKVGRGMGMHSGHREKRERASQRARERAEGSTEPAANAENKAEQRSQCTKQIGGAMDGAHGTQTWMSLQWVTASGDPKIFSKFSNFK